MAKETRRVLVGEFGRAHGIRGEVRLVSYTVDPLAIRRYAPLESEDGTRQFSITALRRQGERLIARIEGVATRDAAEALARTKLYIPRTRLADEERQANEYFVTDLLGLTVLAPDGKRLGHIAAVPNFGAGDLLEVAPCEGGETWLVPFAAPFVGMVDIKAGTIVIDRPPDTGEEKH